MPVTYAKINVSNFLHNLEEIKRITGRKICMAAKADCYGHGAKVLVKAAEESGLVAAAGIADVSEGIRLRQAGVKLPLLIYRGCITEGLDAVVEYDIQPFVSSLEYAKAVEKAAEKADKKVKVHLKVDSGMSRAGCRWEDALPLARYIDASPYLVVGQLARIFVPAFLIAGDIIAVIQEIRIVIRSLPPGAEAIIIIDFISSFQSEQTHFLIDGSHKTSTSATARRSFTGSTWVATKRK